VKNVLLINAALTILFLRATYVGSTHDKWIADTTPYPLPAGSRLLQDLGFLAFTLNQVETIMPTRKPRGRALTRAQKAANRRIARRRVRIEHATAASNAVALSTTPAACGRRASVIWSWKSAVDCITFGYA
jgi:DDE superfamily endonuclease